MVRQFTRLDLVTKNLLSCLPPALQSEPFMDQLSYKTGLSTGRQLIRLRQTDAAEAAFLANLSFLERALF